MNRLLDFFRFTYDPVADELFVGWFWILVPPAIMCVMLAMILKKLSQ